MEFCFNPTEVVKVADASPQWHNNHEDEEEANRNGGSIDEILDTIPPGYRFYPYDYELILYYLKNKVLNLPLPLNQINEVNLYGHSPDFLAGNYKAWGEREWYFFTPRYRKYPNGSRPKREAGNGYWKATGADKTVKFENKSIGVRKALVFYEGKPSRGNKTNWIMHEYRLESKNDRKEANKDSMRLDEWVLCKIYHKARSVVHSPKPRRKRSATVVTSSTPRNNTVPPITQVLSTTTQRPLNLVQTDMGIYAMNDYACHQHLDSHSNSIADQNLFMPRYPSPNNWAAHYGDDLYGSMQDSYYPLDFCDRMDSFQPHCKDF